MDGRFASDWLFLIIIWLLLTFFFNYRRNTFLRSLASMIDEYKSWAFYDLLALLRFIFTLI